MSPDEAAKYGLMDVELVDRVTARTTGKQTFTFYVYRKVDRSAEDNLIRCGLHREQTLEMMQKLKGDGFHELENLNLYRQDFETLWTDHTLGTPRRSLDKHLSEGIVQAYLDLIPKVVPFVDYYIFDIHWLKMIHKLKDEELADPRYYREPKSLDNINTLIIPVRTGRNHWAFLAVKLLHEEIFLFDSSAENCNVQNIEVFAQLIGHYF
jgi:hypothetical protein